MANNRDSETPIFGIADRSLAAKLFNAVPNLIAALQVAASDRFDQSRYP